MFIPSIIKRIQAFNIATTGTGPATATLGIAVDIANSIIIFRDAQVIEATGVAEANDSARVELTNSTTVTATISQRYNAGNLQINGYVVEFYPVVKSIQYITITIADGNQSGGTAISAVNTAKTIVLPLGYTSDNVGPGVFIAGMTHLFFDLVLTSTVLVTASRNGNSGNLVAGACVCEFR